MDPITSTTDLAELAGNTTLLDRIDAAVALVDVTGKIHYCNPAFDKFNRAVRDSVNNLERHASLLECPGVSQALREIIKSGVARSLHDTFFYNRKTQISLTMLARPIVQAPKGKILGAMLTLGEESIAFDNRHLARAQETLGALADRVQLLSKDKINNERLIRILFKEAPFAMLLLNAKGQVVQVNKAGERLFGATVQDILGSTYDSLIDCRQGTRPLGSEAGHTRIDLEEVSSFGRDGQRIPLLRSAVMFDDLDGTLILEAFVDLTERKLAQEEFRRLSEYNDLVLSSTDEGIIGVDLERRVMNYCARSAACCISPCARPIPSPVWAVMNSACCSNNATRPRAWKLLKIYAACWPNTVSSGIKKRLSSAPVWVWSCLTARASMWPVP